MKQSVVIFWVLAAILSGAVSVGNCQQQEADLNSLRNLSDYLRYAALHNAGLRASFEQWKAAVEAVPSE